MLRDLFEVLVEITFYTVADKLCRLKVLMPLVVVSTLIIIFVPEPISTVFIYVFIFCALLLIIEIISWYRNYKIDFALDGKIKKLSEEEYEALVFLKKHEPYSVSKTEIREKAEKKKRYDTLKSLEDMELVITSVSLERTADSFEFYLSYGVKDALLRVPKKNFLLNEK